MKLKKIVLGTTLALAALSAGAVVVAPTVTVKMIAINDFHGNLQSPGSFSTQPGGPGTALVTGHASGGADYLAGYIADLKSKNPNNVVVSAGDLIGASPLISALFHDEGTIEVMNRAGLEFNAVGNHEFDEGKAELLRMQKGGCHPTDANSCQGATVGTPVPFEGAKFKFLAANVVETATGKTIFPPYGIKSFKDAATGKTVRVGFIGMTFKDTPTVVTPSGVAGLQFNDEADTVNALVPKLRAQGVEAIVVLIHQGGFQGTNVIPPAIPNNWINDCKDVLVNATTSPIINVVNRLDDAVDMVVSGHTHTGYNCQLPNKVGRLIPVTQAGNYGRVVTDIDLTLDATTGNVVAVSANNLTVDRTNTAITANATVAGIVSKYDSLVSPIKNQVIGSITTDLPSTANSAGEMPAGDLIADAQLLATQPAGFGGAQIAFMNAGGVRSPGFVYAMQSGTESAGDVTYGEAFTVQPFGNSLVTMTLTGQQIKDVLEQQFVGCKGQTTQRIMQVSNGFKYNWSASAAACNKISGMTLNGTAIDLAANYRVTVNNFMATGGDGFAVLTGGTNLLGGAQDIDALVAYLAGFKSPNAAYNPADLSLNKPRITQLP